MTIHKSSNIVCILSLILLAMVYVSASVSEVNFTVDNINKPVGTKKLTYMKYFNIPSYVPNSGMLCGDGCRENKFSDLEDNNRPLVRYYKYLTKHYDLNLNLPKDMIGGTSALKAKDVIQFTFKEPKEPKIHIVMACFNSEKNQVLGSNFMKKLGNDNRKLLQVKNYVLFIKGGDEKIYNILTESLEDFTALDN